jgi:hypothetical protein
MKTYSAIGTRQYADQELKPQFRTFEAVDDDAARNYIINHYDTSLAWEFWVDNSLEDLA